MTIADTIYDTINDNWGSGGYAGAAPSIDCTESQKSTDVVATDVIEVRHYSLHETGKQVNDKYVDRHYVLDVYISSKTSNAQLKLLYDEVEYLLRNTAMTGIQLEKLDKDWSVSRWEQGKHSVILRVYVLAPLSDGAVTPAGGTGTGLTGEYMADLLMWGSTNAAWVPCAYEVSNNTGGKVVQQSKSISNYDTTASVDLMYKLPLPTNKGSLKLYVSGVRIEVADADATNYVDNIVVWGMDYNSAINLGWSDDNRTAEGSYEVTFAAADASSYMNVVVTVLRALATAYACDIAGVAVRCYYDT